MSDQDASIFGSQTPVEGNPGSSSQNAYDDLLGGITNERGEKKYADVPTALDALASAQNYIPELHQQVDQQKDMIAKLQEELTKRTAVADVIDSLQPQAQEPKADQPVGLDAAAAEALFEAKLNAREQQQARASNTKSVTDTLAEKYGEKAEEMFYKRGQELNLSPEELNSLAGTSPAAVLAMFSQQGPSGQPAPQGSSVFIEPEQTQEVRLGRNTGKSVLSGSTSQDVRAEFDYNKELVSRIHAEGGTIDDLTDPKMYKKYFGNS